MLPRNTRSIVLFFLAAFYATIGSGAWAAAQSTNGDQQHVLYRAALALAEKSLRLNETEDARRWLESAPEKFRGMEWNYLKSMTDECIRSVEGAPLGATAMDVSPDGMMLAVADATGQVTLHRLPGLEPIRAIGDHAQAVYSVAFSHDGRRLATVSRDVTCRVWEVESGHAVSQIKMDNPGVAAVTFSPDGTQVATCTWFMRKPGDGSTVRGVVWIWDASTGNVLHKKEVGVKPLDAIAWSSDGSTIVTGSWDGIVHVLDREGNELRNIPMPEKGVYTAVIAIAISPDGSLVAAGSKDRTARIWNTSDGVLRATCQGHGGFVNEVLFSKDGKRLVTSSVDATIRTWDALNGNALQVLRGHTRDVPIIELLPDDKHLVSVSRDKTFRVWDLNASYGSRQVGRIEPAGCYTTTFSPDGKRIYCAMYNGHVIVLDAGTAKVVEEWDAHTGKSCNSLDINGDGSRILTCSWDKTAKLWNTVDRSLVTTIEVGKGVYGCDLSNDGRLAALFVGNEIQIWDTTSNKLLGTCTGFKNDVHQAAFSPDAKWLVSSVEKETRIWQVDTFECVTVLKNHETNAGAVAMSSDGKYFASGGIGEVILCDLANRQMLRRYQVGDRNIERLSFSPDGSRLAVGSDAITIIDPGADDILLRFQPQDDDVYFLAFSPDGRRLASCTAGGSVVINETVPLRERVLAPTSLK